MELTKITTQEQAELQAATEWEGELSADELQAVAGGVGGAVSNLLVGLSPILPILATLAPAVDKLGDDLQPVVGALL